MADEISNLYLDKEDDYFSQVRSEINDLLPNQVSIVKLSFAKNGGRILQISEKKPST